MSAEVAGYSEDTGEGSDGETNSQLYLRHVHVNK